MERPSFQVTWAPSDADLAAAARLAGDPLLLRRETLGALAPPGARLLLASVWRGDRRVAAATGWERGLPWLRTLTFPALPAFAGPADAQGEVAGALWAGLGALARSRRVPFLELSGLYGPQVAVPGSLGRVRVLRFRREPLVELAAPPAAPPAGAPEADPTGLALDWAGDEAALADHLARLEGGPDGPEAGHPLPPPLEPAAQARLLRAGLATVARARRADETLASLAVLRPPGSPQAALLGVAPAPGAEGLAAAAWLVRHAARDLAGRGVATLSLGGVTETAPEAALRLRLPLATGERRALHAVLVAGPRWPARLLTARDLARRSPRRLAAVALSRLAWRDRFTIHAWGPAEWRAPEPAPGVELRRLSDAEVIASASASDALAAHRAYVERHGVNAAWGLFVGGELAHVTWVFTGALHARLPLASLRLADDEVELGNCVTLPRFKGRGLYPLAIRHLSGQAFQAGVRRVLMATRPGNLASERGIEKAGLARVGRTEVLWLPPLRRARVRREVPGMAPRVEWVDLRGARRDRVERPGRF